MRNGFLTNHDVIRILEMAHAGRSPAYIASVIGCSEFTARRRTAAVRRAQVDAQRRRLLDAYATTEHGTRDTLARRFGYAGVDSLKVAVCNLRKRVDALPAAALAYYDTPEPRHGL